MIFAIQLNYNKVSNFLVTYVVSTKFILFSLLKIYVTTPLHMGLINFKIILDTIRGGISEGMF